MTTLRVTKDVIGEKSITDQLRIMRKYGIHVYEFCLKYICTLR